MSLKVIGAGFGRTGTTSLKAALERLGFNRCYHMFEFMEHPEHAKYWDAASKGKPVDWDALFEGYQSTLDWPGCSYYQELMQRYPDAKVLLTVRDPEKWYQSAQKTIFSAPGGLGGFLRFLLRPQQLRSGLIVRRILFKGTFGGKVKDKAHTVRVFEEHIEEVKRTVPEERLLVYNVKEGWGPLCTFLEVSIPDEPFPHLNDAGSFQEQAEKHFSKARSS